MIFGEEYIITNKFHVYEKSIDIVKVDIKRIVWSNKELYGNKGLYKYFIGYIHKGNALPSQSWIKFPQINLYAKYFDKNNKCMNLLVNYKEILAKYNEIWDTIKNLFGKKFDSEPKYNKQILHAFLFNIRNYSLEVIIIHWPETELNVILPRVNNFDMEQKEHGIFVLL